jgi:hypothetical protein
MHNSVELELVLVHLTCIQNLLICGCASRNEHLRIAVTGFAVPSAT